MTTADVRQEIAQIKARIATCKAKKTAAGKLEAQLFSLVLKQLRKEIRADRKAKRAA